MKTKTAEAVLPYKPKIENVADLKRARDDFRIFAGWWATLRKTGEFKYKGSEIVHKFLVPCLRELIREGSTEFHPEKWKGTAREIYLDAFDIIITKFRYLVAPHAELIYKGKKTATVHARKFIQGSFVSIVGPEYEYGFARFADGKPITWAEFAVRKDEHKVSEDERQEWWPGKKTLYYYKLRTWIPLTEPRHVRVPKGTQTYGERARLNEAVPAADKCMSCEKPPELEVKWAEGMGHAWFCRADFLKWAKGKWDDIDYVKKVQDGKAAKKFADNSNPDIKDGFVKEMKEDAIRDFEYLLHHVDIEDGKEEIHHCLLYDHNANLFEQGHLWIEDGKVFLEGKEIKEGTYHIITGLETKQEVAWSDEEAEKDGIKPKKMVAGMTLKEKGKEW